MDSKQYNRYMLTSRPLITAVNCVLVFSFLSRGIYQLLTIFDILVLPNIPLQVKSKCHAMLCYDLKMHCQRFKTIICAPFLIHCSLQSGKDVHYVILICFALWDYIPVILIITTVTSRQLGNNRYYSNSILFQSSNSRNNSGNRRSKKAAGKRSTIGDTINSSSRGTNNVYGNSSSSSHYSDNQRYN